MAMKTQGKTTSTAERKRNESKDWFGPFANVTSGWLGSRWGFGAAAVFVLVWALTGPVFHYSDTWQLIINSVTNIVTFLMVFLLQNTQNRDAKAINLKLDELIYSISSAKDQMIDIEKLSDKELNALEKRYEKLRHKQSDPEDGSAQS